MSHFSLSVAPGRRFLYLAVAVSLFGGHASAAPRHEARHAVSRDEADDSAYQTACQNLRTGRSYQKAITLGRSLTQRYPTSATYHEFLAAALASRASSLYRTEIRRRFLPMDNQSYTHRLTLWSAGVREKTSPYYGQPVPAPPRLVTVDDGNVQEMTAQDAMTAAAQFARESLREADLALSLADTDEAKGRALFLRATIRRLLRAFHDRAARVSGVTRSAQIESLKDLSGEDDKAGVDSANVADLKTATTLVPGEPIYWQALGDQLLGPLPQNATQPRPHVDEAIVAYVKAAFLMKRPPSAIYYQLGCLYGEKVGWRKLEMETPQAITHVAGDATSDGSLEKNIREAAKYLRYAVDGGSQNATLHYELAGVLGLLSRIGDNDATDRITMGRIPEAVERGNECADMPLICYQEAAPDLLLGARDLLVEAVGVGYYPKEVVHYSTDVAIRNSINVALRAGRDQDAVRGCAAMIHMAFRFCHDLPPADMLLIEPSHRSCSVDEVKLGYLTEISLSNKSGDTSAAASLQAEYDSDAKAINELWMLPMAESKTIYVNP